jgi:hypothetical protein
MPSGTSQPCACIYVENATQTADEILVFAAGASGNVKPLYSIKGAKTDLDDSRGITVDSTGKLYVTNGGNESVTVFAPGAKGDAKPRQTIYGPATMLERPAGIAVDSAGNIYVANSYSQRLNEYRITVYAPNADGNAAPIRVISGGATNLNTPDGIALDGQGDLGVANVRSSALTIYGAGATGDVKPIATIHGPRTKLSTPEAVAFDSTGQIYALDSGAVIEFKPGARRDQKPARTIMGNKTGLEYASDFALDAESNVFVTVDGIDSGSSVIGVNVYSQGAHGNVPPARRISGAKTELMAPTGIAVQP